MKRKKEVISLLLLIIIFIGMFTGCTAKKIDPYTMNETEALIWLKENDIEIPPEIDSPHIGELVVAVAKSHKEGWDMSLAISYEVTVKFIQDIQKHLK